MALINWNESLSVNVAEIDEQHKKLVGMINKLFEAMKSGQGNSVLGDIINEMINYTNFHFNTEEAYFDLFHFEKADIHRKEHKGFVERTKKFKEDFNSGKVLMSIDVMDFLKSWLMHHIKGSDKQYTKCFNENGLL
jgi:hemerythrin-like metal-binding protein